jgi:hypothetical protein
MKYPKWIPTGEVETYITARGRSAHRPRMVPNPAYREPSASGVTELVKAYDRDKQTCCVCRRRVHWFVMPGHHMAPAMDADGRLVHVGCLEGGATA